MTCRSINIKPTVLKELEKATQLGDLLTVRDVARQVGVSEKYARDVLHDLHEIEQVVHIGDWKRESATGPRSAAYRIGRGKDVARPETMSSLQKQTRYRQRIREQQKQLVLDLMTHGEAMTAKEAACKLDLSHIGVQSILIEMHEEDQALRVESWRAEDDFKLSPVYIFGAGDDAPMPSGFCMADARCMERARASYLIMKERSEQWPGPAPRSKPIQIRMDEMAMNMFPWMYGKNTGTQAMHRESEAA